MRGRSGLGNYEDREMEGVDVHQIGMTVLYGPHILEVHPEVTGEERQREEDDGSEGQTTPI